MQLRNFYQRRRRAAASMTGQSDTGDHTRINTNNRSDAISADRPGKERVKRKVAPSAGFEHASQP